MRHFQYFSHNVQQSICKATVCKSAKNPPHFSTLHFVGKDDALTMVGNVGLAYFDSTRFSLRWIRIANS